MFKKIIAILVIFITLPVYATLEEEYCAPKPYPVGGNGSHIISNITGINAVFTKAAELVMQHELKNEFNSNFNVELYSFGGRNLLEGKFRKIKVDAKKITSEDIYMHNFKSEALCPYNRIVLDKDKIYFMENFLMSYQGEMTQEDFTNTVLSKRYLDLIKKSDINLLGMNIFKLHDPKAEIRNNRIFMSLKATVSGMFISKTITFSFDYGLRVENGKILLSDINFNNGYGLSNAEVLEFINKLNPFKIRVAIDDNTYMNLKIQDIKIESNKIFIKGFILIPKNV